MAVVIARRWSLGVLQVSLDEAPEDPTVTCEIVINEGPRREVGLRRQFPIWSFGEVDSIGRHRVRELDLAVPAELVDALADWVRGGADNRAVLWIHLIKPYGILGAVPWEQMEAAIGIPVLRLPDVLPDQTPPSEPINIAVCAAAQQHKGGDLSLVEVADEIVNAAGSLRGRAWVHFFVDQVTAGQLTRQLSRVSSDQRRVGAEWTVHRWDQAKAADPGTLQDRHSRVPARAENPWLAWIQDAARMQSFDVLHFICDGYVTGHGDQGALALPVSPADADFEAASHVTAVEVLNTAQTVGAFGVGFSSLRGNYSTSGTRLVADAVGANRAGPVFMYDHAHGGDDDLRYAYRLILGDALSAPPHEGGMWSGAPRLDLRGSSLLFYIQPDLIWVDDERAEEDQVYGVTLRSPEVADIEATFPSMNSLVTGVRNSRPWASVLARYVDEKRSDLTPLWAARRTGNLDEDGLAYMEGVEKALEHLDSVLMRYTEDTQ